MPRNLTDNIYYTATLEVGCNDDKRNDGYGHDTGTDNLKAEEAQLKHERMPRRCSTVSAFISVL